MIPIYQSKENNCIAACLASIMEDVDIMHNFPPLQDNYTWFAFLRKYMRARFGYGLLLSNFDENTPGYAIIGGPTVRTPENKKWHAVVYHNGKLIHDPYEEDGPGLTTPVDCIVMSTNFKYFANNGKLNMSFINRFE